MARLVRDLLAFLLLLTTLPFVLCFRLARGIVRMIRRAAGTETAYRVGEAAGDAAERAADVAAAGLKASARAAWVGLRFFARWLGSVKDDVLPAEEERDVNPIGLLAKLVTIAGLLVVVGVLGVKGVRWWSA